MEKDIAQIQSREINLVPQEEISQEPVNKFFSWSLNVGRYIVIGVELLMIVVWVTRSKFDADVQKMEKMITSKAQVISEDISFQDKFLAIQKKLKVLGATYQSVEKRTPVLEFVEKNIPQDVSLDRFALTADGNVILSGIALNYQAVAQLISAFQADARFGNITILSLTRDEKNNQITFAIQAHLGVLPTPTVPPPPVQ